MSKIRTSTEIQDILDREFAWRLIEISDIKTTVRSLEGTKSHTFLRAGVALLYAHWEGFIKNSSQSYLTFVASQKLKYQELKACFIVFGVKKHLESIVSSKKHFKNTQVIEFLIAELNNRATLMHKGAIDTESNLSSLVFQNIAASIGIDASAYETKYKLIDESLLERRNKIAHGESLDIGIEEYSTLSDEIVSLMRAYKNDIENAVVMKSYKISPPTP